MTTHFINQIINVTKMLITIYKIIQLSTISKLFQFSQNLIVVSPHYIEHSILSCLLHHAFIHVCGPLESRTDPTLINTDLYAFS